MGHAPEPLHALIGNSGQALGPHVRNCNQEELGTFTSSVRRLCGELRTWLQKSRFH